MRRLRPRDALAAILIGTAVGIAVIASSGDGLRGLSIDALTALRWHTFGPVHDPASSPAVVVALDEETYRSPPFQGTPNVTWTNEIGRVLTAIIDGGAKVVGFDIVFPTSIEQSGMPFGDQTLGERVRGFDREFLRVLAAQARQDAVVLGQFLHAEHPILPTPGQSAAVGHQRNIRPLNTDIDADEVIRRVPLTFAVDGATMPSMAVELAARALGAAPVFHDGSMILADYVLPNSKQNALTLNFAGGADDIPTFSLAQIHVCAVKQDREFFRRNFAGKVVLIGTVLDVEDRKLTSKRFATAPEGVRAGSCAPKAATQPDPITRNTISGVYIHATAVNNLIRREGLTELGPISRVSITASTASLIAVTTVVLGPFAGTAIVAVVALVSVVGAIAAFTHALVLPLSETLLACLIAFGLAGGYRFTVTEREGRLLRNSFALYLAPAVIEKMMASDKPPILGGETRVVTVLFFDLEKFSALSEAMPAAELVRLMNTYLAAMTDLIEASGGFVDQYLGDGIKAVFGAPLDDSDHAVHAVLAALLCQRRLDALNESGAAFDGKKLAHRIGINSGDALVGNIGSRRRFNYTVIGDAVNVASRVEGANKFYGTTTVATEATVALCGSAFAWRELDAVYLQGRRQPVKIFELLGESGSADLAKLSNVTIYAEGLASWRARDFDAAVTQFSRISGTDRPAALFLERASVLAAAPPGDDWVPVATLKGK